MANQSSKPRKVLFLITKSNWGGAQRYVYDLATNLDKNKFEPVVALGGDGTLVTMLENAHVRVIKLTQMRNDASLKNAWQNFRELLKIVRQEKPTVLHLNSSIAGLLGAIVGRLAFVPKIIFTAHGWAFNEDRSFGQRLIIKCLHYLTVLLAHRTIAVSSAIVKQMNWPGVRSKMKIINPGRTIGPMYERSDARTKIIDFCPTLAKFSSDQWIVSIAELHPIKRHLVMIEALAAVIKKQPSTRLILIGEGTERSNIENKITKLGLQDNIFLLGNIVEAARFLKAFDLFVLASKSESYGYVLVEAGLAQVPIITTNVGGTTDIVENTNEGILIKPDDVSALTAAILITSQNDTQTSDRVNALYNKLHNRTVTKMIQQTESLYEL